MYFLCNLLENFLSVKLQLNLHKYRKILSVEKEIARFLVNRYQKA